MDGWIGLGIFKMSWVEYLSCRYIMNMFFPRVFFSRQEVSSSVLSSVEVFQSISQPGHIHAHIPQHRSSRVCPTTFTSSPLLPTTTVRPSRHPSSGVPGGAGPAGPRGPTASGPQHLSAMDCTASARSASWKVTLRKGQRFLTQIW